MGKATLTETRDPAPELQTQERESREQEKANDATRSHGAKDSPGAVPAPSGRAFRELGAEAGAARNAGRVLGPEAGARARKR